MFDPSLRWWTMALFMASTMVLGAAIFAAGMWVGATLVRTAAGL
jgi:hypothetical protein